MHMLLEHDIQTVQGHMDQNIWLLVPQVVKKRTMWQYINFKISIDELKYFNYFKLNSLLVGIGPTV